MKHNTLFAKKLFTGVKMFVAAAAMCLSMSTFSPVTAHAQSINDANMFVKQPKDGDRSCNACSQTMLLKRTFYLLGKDPNSVTLEGTRRTTCAKNSLGNYTLGKASYNYQGISVARHTFNKNANTLKSLLDQHPEGIVLFRNDGHTHAVLVTDYQGGVFYAADPANCSGKGRIPLTSTFRVRVETAGYYWAVSSPSIPRDRLNQQTSQPSAPADNCSTSYAGNYTCTAPHYLQIREGHGTNYRAIGRIYPGKTVYVSRGNGSWAHVSYNGVNGYVSMSYLKKYVPAPSNEGWYTCTAPHYLQIRAGRSTRYRARGRIYPGRRVYVTSVSGGWGKVSYNGVTGYVSMSYLRR